VKKIVLFFPETHLQRSDDAWCLPPLSLLAIAAPLIQDNYEVKILDSRVDGNCLPAILAEAREAVCLGISVLTGHQIKEALQVSQEVKRILPALPVIWGGYHPTLLSEQTIADPAIDIVVKGQGEITFSELVEALSAGRPLHGIEGVIFKEEGRVVTNPERCFADVNRFPSSSYSLIDMETHFPDLEFGRRTIGYVSSQGCPHGCQFCAESTAYNRRWSGLSPQRVGDDLEHLIRRYDGDGVIFVDNNFFVDEQRVQGICTEIIRRGLRFKWGAQGRADQIARLSSETFDLLRRSGFIVFHVGAESGSDRQLEQVSKTIERQTTVACAKVCKKQGIRISFGFIFGFPGETAADIRANFSLMEEVTDIQGEYDCIVHFFAPSPGSELLNVSVGLGAASPNRLTDWIPYNTIRGMTPWIDARYIDRIRRRVDYFYPFARPNTVFRERIAKRSRSTLLFSILHLITRLRYRFRLFALPVDWWFYKQYKNIRQMYQTINNPRKI
jgi:anaerobic magnesium-protoporphyrin IX monomethyl ester cyclase